MRHEPADRTHCGPIHRPLLDIAVEARGSFETMFRDAGFTTFQLVETKNEYWGNSPTAEPWFLCKTFHGTIKIGWRDSENVTKGEHMIHAWSPEMAVEYLTRIRAALG